MSLLTQVFRPLRALVDELKLRFPLQYGSEIEKIEDSAETQLQSLVDSLTDRQVKELLGTIRSRRASIDMTAAYGNEVVSTSKQILAFGGAGIALVAAFAPKLNDFPPTLLKCVGVASLFYLNLIVLSFYTIFRFIWVSRFRYPFLYLRRLGNTIPFFYYRAISPEVPRSLFQTAEERLKAVRLYVNDLIGFAKHLVPTPNSGVKASGIEDPNPDSILKRKVVRDELQQYFLLISYQGYVNQFEVRMNNQFLYGLSASLLCAIVLGFFVFLR